MNGNFVQITENNGIFINGTKISQVLDYSLKATPHGMEMSIRFDVGRFEAPEHAPETSEELNALYERVIALEEKTDRLTKMLCHIQHDLKN